MAPLMYRLIFMGFDVGSFNEVIRLGLLVFCCQIFLQWEVVTMTHAHLHASFKECLSRLESPEAVPPHLLAWLLMVGEIPTHRTSDTTWSDYRLKNCIGACGFTSWDDMRQNLESFLWIGVVQEKPGKEIFDSIMSKDVVS